MRHNEPDCLSRIVDRADGIPPQLPLGPAVLTDLPSLTTSSSHRAVVSILSFLVLLPMWLSCVVAGPLASPDDPPDTGSPTPEQLEFARSKVLPLLESRCFECHGSASAAKGGLQLTSMEAILAGGDSGPALVRHQPDESLLIQAVRYESFEMPPRSRLPAEEVEILAAWIRDGAAWPMDSAPASAPQTKADFPLQQRIESHWAWKKIVAPPVPDVARSDWPVSSADRFVFDKLHAAGLTPAPDADRRTILRRLYFDLIGLPPSVEEQQRFFDNPADTATAMEEVVDELLASPHFGERWGRHWLDLVRYAETLGHEFDFPLPYAWRYRDYVIRALNADVPYDQFVREHVAGDLLENPRLNREDGFNESIIATGFWFLGEEVHAPVDVHGDEALRIDNQIDVFGKTFLGLTISCARCHDHKFDPIMAEDYYGLCGFLQSSRRRVEWLDSSQKTAELLQSLRNQQQHVLDLVQQATGDSRHWQKILSRALESPAEDEHRDVTAMRSLLADSASLELTHPLSLFAALQQKPAERPDSDVVRDWCARRQQIQEHVESRQPHGAPDSPDGWPTAGPDDLSRAIVLADVTRGGTAGWSMFGAAFGDSSGASPADSQPAISGDTRNLRASLTPSTQLPGVHPGISSARLSEKLRGQLHSAEFVLSHPEVLVLVAGKNARLRLVIDGYVMNEFSELLFSGCRQAIDTNGEFRWLRLGNDVHRYIGHRCHLEFLDEGDGWFAVKQVCLVPQAGEPPPELPEISKLNLRAVDPESGRDAWIRGWSPSDADPDAAGLLADQLAAIGSATESPLTAAWRTWRTAAEQPQGGFPVLVMCDGSAEEEHIFIRGNPHNPGRIAGRRLLTALDQSRPLFTRHGSGRLELVDRMLADDNPFPARVAVNRIWQHLFGRGLVATSDNFGVLGEAPTHPELLDHLADQFRRDGWSVKRLIRRLVLSRTYRMSSLRNVAAENTDPTNRWWHRFPVRRLESEAIRDEILAVSGRLDPTMSGPPVPVYLTDFMQGRGRPGESGPLDGAGRRSIYQAVRRNFLNPFLLTFDTPRPATAVSRRSQSNVPAQALIMLNNAFLHEQSEVWATRLLRESDGTPQGAVTLAFRQALARNPEPAELSTLLELIPAGAELNTATLQGICHVLLNQKEFVYLD